MLKGRRKGRRHAYGTTETHIYSKEKGEVGTLPLKFRGGDSAKKTRLGETVKTAVS